MFIKKKKNRSGTTSIVVAEKTKGSYKELVTIGVAKDANDIDSLVNAPDFVIAYPKKYKSSIFSQQ